MATTAPTASQSATRLSRARSNARLMNVPVIASAMSGPCATLALGEPERDVLPAAGNLSVAALRQHGEQIDGPAATCVFDHDQLRQQGLRCVTQKRAERDILRSLDIDLQGIDRADTGIRKDIGQTPARNHDPI